MSDSIQGGAATIKLIQETAVKAAGVTIHTLPDRRTYVVAQDGIIAREGEIAPAATRDHVYAVSDLITAYERMVDDVTAVWHCGPPVQSPGIAFVIDLAEHREQVVRMPLRLSAQYGQLAAMADAPEVLGHADLIRLLKHDWRGCCSKDLPEIFRSVNFESLQRVQSEKAAGLDSLDASVSRKVTGASTFPDEFFVKAPLYNNVGLSSIFLELHVGIEIDVNSRKFLLQLVPGELEEAIDKAHAEIGSRLAAEFPEGADILYGSPATTA